MRYGQRIIWSGILAAMLAGCRTATPPASQPADHRTDQATRQTQRDAAQVPAERQPPIEPNGNHRGQDVIDQPRR
ncbi:MAG: hypothetical protein HJJLKODD_00866 [Phycisphaerae bacterium]|nr:hypothetical protein [Phycisphaerae bacterium]